MTEVVDRVMPVNIYNHAPARARLRELEKKTKADLAALWHKRFPNAWTAHPVVKWRKDEIAWDIVHLEFKDIPGSRRYTAPAVDLLVQAILTPDAPLLPAEAGERS